MSAPPSTSVTIVDWNVDGWHTIRDEQLDLLDAAEAQVLLLQEVTPASIGRLRGRGWSGTAALELLPSDHTERDGVHPRFSCAVLARGRADVCRAELVPDAPSPVRGLAADVEFGGHVVRAVSAALPPGSMWGRRAKVGQARALAKYLASWSGPTVLGIDRNGPKFERWDPDETVWWREDDPTFFADDAEHGLRDVLRQYHDIDPEVVVRAREDRPDGPQAVSYVEHRTTPPTPRRYDAIMVSHHWSVRRVTYDHDGAVSAGSDHAIVTAVLRLRDDTEAGSRAG